MKAVRLAIPVAMALFSLILITSCAGPAAAPGEPAPSPAPEPAPAPEPTPSPGPAPTPTAMPIPEELIASHFGFLGACFDAGELTGLGVNWDRPHPGPFIWDRVEKKEGSYDWREIDRYVQNAQSYNLATLATIWPFAEWDQANWEQDGTAPDADPMVFENELGRSRRKPHDMDAYRSFVSALVERYDGDGKDDMPGLKFPIKYWEASNEPDMQSGVNTFFNGTSEDYLEILEVTYQAVKEADPEAEVLHAGMAGMESWMVSFWEPIMEKGSQYFDIANIHSIGTSDELNVPEFKKLLSKYGIDKPIWVTEAQHRMGKTLDGRNVSPEEHGQILAKSYVISFACGTDKIFYTSFRAPPSGPAEFGQAALVGESGEKRPAYYAMQSLIHKLKGFTLAEELAEGQYRFTVGGGLVYVLWGGGELPEEITGEVLLTDLYGKETRTDRSAIKLTESPIFVEIITASP